MMAGRKKKALNFIKAEWQKDRCGRLKQRRKGILILVPLLLLFCFLQYYIYLVEKTEEALSEAGTVTSWLESDEVKADRAEQEYQMQLWEQLQLYEEEEHMIRTWTEETVELSGGFLKDIESVMGGAVNVLWDEGYPVRFEEGKLIFTARTKVAYEASSYIQRLEETGIFRRVEYHGFEQRLDAETGDTYYLFEVVCHIDQWIEGGDNR